MCFMCNSMKRLLLQLFRCILFIVTRSIIFCIGFGLGLLYYYYLLSNIPFPNDTGVVIGLLISLLLGLGNVICAQLRCIFMLTVPMYCGKPGRGVLKFLALTCVIAGPISNMALNAKEVVRVFACSNQLSQELARARHERMAAPVRDTARGLRREVDEIKDTLRSIRNVVDPIIAEIENTSEVPKIHNRSDSVDRLFENSLRSEKIEAKYLVYMSDEPGEVYQKKYQAKLEYRCEDQISRTVTACSKVFASSHSNCLTGVPKHVAWLLCWPMNITYLCNVFGSIGNDICDVSQEVDPGLGEGYAYLKEVTKKMSENFHAINLQQIVTYKQKLSDIQDARETSDRVLHEFEGKMAALRTLTAAVNTCAALLFLRILYAAGVYHDNYLTSIEYDNFYITSYFKRLDRRREALNKPTLLPLKKMERFKYIDVHSFAWLTSEHSNMPTQILKTMFEMVTATTFVMLDRLFYEALDLVRRHAEADSAVHKIRDMDLKVYGDGALARIVQRLAAAAGARRRRAPPARPPPCVPRPSPLPPALFMQIYGYYLWILLLIYLGPYTMRLKRLICGYFYPRREKQRILHLYNDILKKRLKLHKTLRRRALASARAHYLTAENLLSLRTRFPHMLGWLNRLPAGRTTCLICGETEPRDSATLPAAQAWHWCAGAGAGCGRCPFATCAECWRDAGGRCLACEPGLAELSDVDSLSDDDHRPVY